MEEEQKKLITRNYRALAADFSTAVDDICNHLLEEKIISEHMRQDILAKNTPLDQAYQLLELIERRGPRAFEVLYNASKEQTLYTACDILMPDNAPHEPPEEVSSSEEIEDDYAEPRLAKVEEDPWSSSSYVKDIRESKLECKPAQEIIYQKHIQDAKNTPLDQAYQLLELIERRGPRAFEVLYNASKEQTLYTACDILMPDNAPHEPPEEVSSSEEIEDDYAEPRLAKVEEDPWSSSSYVKDIRESKLECKPAQEIIYQKHIQDDDFYQMKDKKRGQLVVLHDDKNPLFVMDRKILDCLCTKLNFDYLKVKHIKDENNLDVFKSSLSSSSCNCLVLLLMSTGQNGFLNRKEGLKKVKDILKNEQNLASKPKIIFHMTLKSDKEGEKCGATPEEKGKGEQAGAMNNPLNSGGGDNIQSQDEFEENNSLDGVDGPNPNERAPKDSDIIIVQVTEYGCEVLPLGEDRITRFIHLIVDVFFKNAYNLDFYGLLCQVNRRSKRRVVNCCATGRRILCFFPGCPQNESV